MIFEIILNKILKGNKEGVDPFVKFLSPWSAFQTDDHGYTIMKVANATHLSLEQISIEKVGIFKKYFKISIFS